MVEKNVIEHPTLLESRGKEPAPVDPTGKPGYYLERTYDYLLRHPSSPIPAPNYYWLYAFRNCASFWQRLPRFSSEGKQWVLSTGLELQRLLEEKRQVSPTAFARLEENPADFRRFAIATHSEAYLKDGRLPYLPHSDWVLIVTTPGLLDLLGPEGLKTALTIARKVIPAWVLGLAKTETKLSSLVVDGGINETDYKTPSLLMGEQPASLIRFLGPTYWLARAENCLQRLGSVPAYYTVASLATLGLSGIDENLSSPGREWSSIVGLSLQLAFENDVCLQPRRIAEMESLQADLNRWALQRHHRVYLDAGFRHLPTRDIVKISGAILRSIPPGLVARLGRHGIQEARTLLKLFPQRAVA